MAILDYAMHIMELTKHCAAPLQSNGSVQSAPTGHPFIMGEHPVVMEDAIYTGLPGKYIWDFAADPLKPVLGDKFAFRFSRIQPRVPGSTTGAVKNTANQYVIEFVDSAGLTIGGLRFGGTAIAVLTMTEYTYTLIANGNTAVTVDIAGTSIFPRLAIQDLVIECTVTSANIVISIYAANYSQSMAGTPAALVATVTAPNTVSPKGPVSKMRITPGSTVMNYSGNPGRDQAPWVAAILAVNEDLTRMFVSNVLVPTLVGGDLTDLPVTGAESISEFFGKAQWSAYFSGILDQRRTLKIAPIAGAPFPTTGHNIIIAKFDVTYGLSMSAKAVLPDTDLEMFTRYGSVNYSIGRFGKDGGSMQYELTLNPATGIPFDGYGEIQIGLVLREKV